MKKFVALTIVLYAVFTVKCQLEPNAEITEKSTIKMEEFMANELKVQDVEQYPAYYVDAAGGLHGVSRDRSFTPLLIGTDQGGKKPLTFFSMDGKLYFKVQHTFPPETEGGEAETVVKCCEQDGRTISYLDDADFPEVQPVEHVELSDGDYSVSIDTYSGGTISVAHNGEYGEPMRLIDGLLTVDGGALLHVQEGRAGRPEGVLFWPEGARTMTKVKDKGRFWRL